MITAKEFFKDDKPWWDNSSQSSDTSSEEPTIDAPNYEELKQSWGTVIPAKDFFREDECWWRDAVEELDEPKVISAKEFFKDDKPWWEESSSDEEPYNNHLSKHSNQLQNEIAESDHSTEVIKAKDFFREEADWWEINEEPKEEVVIKAKEFFKDDEEWWKDDNEANYSEEEEEIDESFTEEWETANDSVLSDSSTMYSFSDGEKIPANELFAEQPWWDDNEEETGEIVDSDEYNSDGEQDSTELLSDLTEVNDISDETILNQDRRHSITESECSINLLDGAEDFPCENLTHYDDGMPLKMENNYKSDSSNKIFLHDSKGAKTDQEIEIFGNDVINLESTIDNVAAHSEPIDSLQFIKEATKTSDKNIIKIVNFSTESRRPSQVEFHCKEIPKQYNFINSQLMHEKLLSNYVNEKMVLTSHPVINKMDACLKKVDASLALLDESLDESYYKQVCTEPDRQQFNKEFHSFKSNENNIKSISTKTPETNNNVIKLKVNVPEHLIDSSHISQRDINQLEHCLKSSRLENNLHTSLSSNNSIPYLENFEFFQPSTLLGFDVKVFENADKTSSVNHKKEINLMQGENEDSLQNLLYEGIITKSFDNHIKGHKSCNLTNDNNLENKEIEIASSTKKGELKDIMCNKLLISEEVRKQNLMQDKIEDSNKGTFKEEVDSKSFHSCLEDHKSSKLSKENNVKSREIENAANIKKSDLRNIMHNELLICDGESELNLTKDKNDDSLKGAFNEKVDNNSFNSCPDDQRSCNLGNDNNLEKKKIGTAANTKESELRNIMHNKLLLCDEERELNVIQDENNDSLKDTFNEKVVNNTFNICSDDHRRCNLGSDNNFKKEEIGTAIYTKENELTSMMFNVIISCNEDSPKLSKTVNIVKKINFAKVLEDHVDFHTTVNLVQNFIEEIFCFSTTSIVQDTPFTRTASSVKLCPIVNIYFMPELGLANNEKTVKDSDDSLEYKADSERSSSNESLLEDDIDHEISFTMQVNLKTGSPSWIEASPKFPVINSVNSLKTETHLRRRSKSVSSGEEQNFDTVENKQLLQSMPDAEITAANTNENDTNQTNAPIAMPRRKRIKSHAKHALEISKPLTFIDNDPNDDNSQNKLICNATDYRKVPEEIKLLESEKSLTQKSEYYPKCEPAQKHSSSATATFGKVCLNENYMNFLYTWNLVKTAAFICCIFIYVFKVLY